jgi:hypothetical protein
MFSEETNAATLLQQAINLLPFSRDAAQPIVLPETYGIRVAQGTVASVNNYGFIVDFTVV